MTSDFESTGSACEKIGLWKCYKQGGKTIVFYINYTRLKEGRKRANENIQPPTFIQLHCY